MSSGTTLFATTPGNLVAIKSTRPRMLKLSLGPTATPTLPTDIGIVQGISLIGRVQAQTQLALNSALHVTPFGDQPGQIQLNTILAPTCVGDSNSSSGDEHGAAIDKFIRYYNDRKLKPGSNLEPLYITIGSTTARGYLLGYQLNGQAQASQLYSGTLTFLTLAIGT